MLTIRRTFLPLLLATLWGCSQSTAPVYYPRPIIARFVAYKSTTVNSDSSSTSYKDAYASFWSTASPGSVFGGTVTMNSTLIPSSRSSGEYGSGNVDFIGYGIDSSKSGDPSLPITFNGGPLIFSISGSSQFSALTDSISFPDRDINITSPAPYVRISDSAGYTITWDYTPGSRDSIMISVPGPCVSCSAVIQLYPGDDGLGLFASGYTTADNGSFTIPPSPSYRAGVGGTGTEFYFPQMITVTRYREKYGLDKLGRKYIMEAYTSTSMIDTLVP